MRYSIFSVQDHHPQYSRTVPELYEEVLEQGVLADALGYDSFFVAEHHFHEYGAVPDPAVFLAALAQRTKNIRLGPAISILTFHHPLTVAENYAMLDILSKGRLVMGVGSGYLKHEFEGYQLDAEEKRARFDEHLAILKKAWSGERFSFDGKFTSCKDVLLNVQPVQQNSPLYLAILRSEAAYHVGRKGDKLISVPYASLADFSEIGQLVSDYKKGLREGGHTDGDALYAFHTYVAETDEQARRDAESPFDLYVRTRLYARQQTFGDVQESGLGLFGSPETVAEKINRLHDMGVEHVLLLMNFGLLPHEKVKSSMRLFAEKVIPLVDKKIHNALHTSKRA
ncbi:MAG: hypothetical protein FD123_1015 [Bacteroidetes bacterium]|nr:MAG: hypothetical protein FD123_1015 [Bacteroidota bacterium]